MRFINFKSVSSEEGASSVEFALLAGLLFAIVFITIDFGIWSANQTVITGAARDAAVQFSLTRSAKQAMAKAMLSSSRLSSGSTGLKVSLAVASSTDAIDSARTIDAIDNACQPGDAVKVSISYPRSLLFGNSTFWAGSVGATMTAASVTICE